MTELIATKIVPPRRRADLLDRPRLLNTLLENAHLRLILVSAPAGYGKTSLLVDFAHRLEYPVCWYTVTETDGNLWTFARYIIGAIRQQVPAFGERSLRHIEHEAAELDALVTTLVNELHALDSPLWLIIDDFHLVERADAIRAFLEALIPLLPENCHLVIASRTVPDLGPKMVARLVARREVIGLGRDALRFTPEEIRTFLRKVYRRDISPEEARQLAEASEGWITAIILTSQAGDPMAGIARARSAGGRLYDYLASEVLEQLPPRTRNFLLESSILEEMDPQVVNALLGMDDAARVLEHLERQNVFVMRLEETRGEGRRTHVWYRYHSLFREFLQSRLRETNPQRFWALQQRAAHVLMQAGRRSQAIDYLLRAGAYEEAAAAIEEETHSTYTTAQADQLSRWIDALPSEVLERHPRLLRYRAKICIERDGDPARAIRLCEKAEALLDRERQWAELAWTLIDKATALRIQGRFNDVISCCKQAIKITGEDASAVTAGAQQLIGLAYAQTGRLDEGVAALRAALDYWQSLGDSLRQALLHNDLGTVLRRMGNLTASDLHFQKALEIWETLGDLSRAAMTLNNLALGHHYQGRYNEALQEYRRALQHAQEGASRRHGAYILIGMGDVYQDLGRYTDAVEAYKQGLQDARKVGDAFLSAYALNALGQTLHLMGNTQEGVALVRQAYEDARERGARYEMALYQLSLGIIAHEAGFLDEAANRLKQCIEYFRQGYWQELARAYLHLAQTHYLGDALQAMQECIREAEVCLFRLGYDGFILPTLRRTAGAIHAAADASPYLMELLRQAEEKLGPAPEAARRPPQPALRVYVLGQSRVYRGERLLTHPDWTPRQRVQELFFYLLMRPQQTALQIGAALWPDLPPAKVTNNLYATVSRLRRALGTPDSVLNVEGRYALQVPRLWVDAHQFREAIELARTCPNPEEEVHHLERAVALYRGDFLADFPACKDGTWIHEEREALRHLCELALERLIEYWTAQGDAAKARHYAQRRVALLGEPLS